MVGRNRPDIGKRVVNELHIEGMCPTVQVVPALVAKICAPQPRFPPTPTGGAHQEDSTAHTGVTLIEVPTSRKIGAPLVDVADQRKAAIGDVVAGCVAERADEAALR